MLEAGANFVEARGDLGLGGAAVSSAVHLSNCSSLMPRARLEHDAARVSPPPSLSAPLPPRWSSGASRDPRAEIGPITDEAQPLRFAVSSASSSSLVCRRGKPCHSPATSRRSARPRLSACNWRGQQRGTRYHGRELVRRRRSSRWLHASAPPPLWRTALTLQRTRPRTRWRCRAACRCPSSSPCWLASCSSLAAATSASAACHRERRMTGSMTMDTCTRMCPL